MPGPTTKLLLQKQEKRRLALGTLYDVMDVGVEEQNFTDAKLGDLIGLPQGTVKDYSHDFQEMGILKRRLEYGDSKNGLRPGRHYHWTLLVRRDAAMEMLTVRDAAEIRSYEKNFRTGIKKAKATMRIRASVQTSGTNKLTPTYGDEMAIRTVNETPVEAIVGPDRPSPFDVLAPIRRDEPYALVEAARQYKSRGTKMDSKIQALLDQAKELGMSVDVEALRGAIAPVEPDDRLDSVALVLPYIDGLEATVENLKRTIEGLKTQVHDLDQMRRDVTALRAQNQRLIAQAAN